MHCIPIFIFVFFFIFVLSQLEENWQSKSRKEDQGHPKSKTYTGLVYIKDLYKVFKCNGTINFKNKITDAYSIK